MAKRHVWPAQYAVYEDWQKVPERILSVAGRLKRVHIESRPAVEVTRGFAAHADALIYADPPYLLERDSSYYSHVMSETDHEELLLALREHAGPVLLSGYAHELYENLLGDWTRTSTLTRAEKGKEREEVLWLNPVAFEALEGKLFY